VRAITLLELERYDAALAAAERAISEEPHNARGHEIRMIVLKQLGRDDEALAALNQPQVYALSPRVRALLGVTQMEAGLRDDARVSLRAALEADPGLAFARFNLAEIDADGDDIAALERLIARADVSRHDRMLLNFALGKCYLAGNDHARAFARFRDGNDMKRQTLDYDVVHDERSMTALAAEFSAAVLAEGLPGADPSERPIFVVGMPRSGTSLVEQVLASHPAVFGAGELKAMARLAARRHSAGRAEWPALAAEYLAAAGARAAGARAGGAARVVDKLPLNFLNVGFIRLLLPNARIIHCRRNPVDNALSCYTILFDEGNEFSYDLTDLGRFYHSYQTLMEHWRTVVPPDRFFEIDYEAIVADVEGEARRLVSFCGLAWDDAVLRFHQTKRAVRTASKLQVRKPIYRTSIDRAAAFGAALDPLRRALAAS
jgi:tetratricopeptide (TPR) repeat protein